MNITEKENILRFYRHEKPEHMPDLSYLFTLHPAKGFLERPIDAEGMVTDWFGVEYVFEAGAGASLPDTRKPPVVTDITKWREQIRFPDLDDMDWEAAAARDGVDSVDRENKVLSVLVQCGLYERLHALTGMEQAFIAMLTEPEDTQDLLSAIAGHKIRLFKKIIKYYRPDIIRHHDDWGTQLSMQMSPELWREIIKPHIAGFVETCHSEGVLYEQHSCGLIEPIVPDMVEIGVDSWQGMHINDVPKLQKTVGNKLLFHMSLDVQRYMAWDKAGKLSESSLRKDVRDTIMDCASFGNYFPVMAIADPNWWGTAAISDEMSKCAASVEFQ